MVDYHTREKISHSGKRIFQSLIFFPECGHLPSHPQLKAVCILFYYTLCKFLTLSIHFIGQAAFVNFH
jgi:hypothetical protein